LPPGIYFFSLKLCQEPDCLFRNRRIISQRLQGGDNTVPPKESDEPWHAGSEVGNVVSQLASQHIEIPQRSLEHSIKQQTIGLDLRFFRERANLSLTSKACL